MKAKKQNVEQLNNEEVVLLDPYSHFLQEYDDEFEDDELLSIDDTPREMNPERFKEYLESILEESIKTKKSWVANAMKHDPGFMVNPIEDHYYKFIDDELKQEFTAPEIEEFIAILDPVTWGEKNLLQKHDGWKPRVSRDGIPFQSMLIRCKSKRIVARAGRRIGKTAALVVRLLHKAFTFVDDDKHPVYNITIFTPQQSQIELIFKMIALFIDDNPKLIRQLKEGRIPTRKTPFYQLEWENGKVIIRGFVSGSDAIRGFPANYLVIDEGSYLTRYDTDSVVALMAENKDVEVWVSSTPKGLKDWFYDRAFDKKYVSFHFPSDKFHPAWDRHMEDDFRSELTDAGYNHEVLAIFSADGEGVFQYPFIEAAISDYSYDTQVRKEHCLYGIGCDWNDPKNGTQIKVIEFDPQKFRYKIVDSASISIEGWTQTVAVRKIRDMNRKWQANFVYVDKGHGGMQIEALHEIGMKAPPKSIDKRLTKVKGVGFKETLLVTDPWIKKKVKKQTKSFMVQNAVRIFESGVIDISSEDDKLIAQLGGYVLHSVSPSGEPVYKGDERAGDHALDATMICLLGFILEYSQIGNPRVSTNIGMTDNFIKNKTAEDKLPEYIRDSAQKSRDIALIKDKRREKQEYEDSHRKSNIFSPSGASIKLPRTNHTLNSVRRHTLLRRSARPVNSRKF